MYNKEKLKLKTSRPFSTISYNSADFITVKLNDLIRQRKIDFWCFFDHFAEEDESKAHKHLFIVPNGQINTDQIADLLVEIDTTNPTKPLKCIMFKPSKFADWYLYALHDFDYLASKGQARHYHYTINDAVCSDFDYLNELVHTIDFSALNRSKALKTAIDDGTPFEELLVNGLIPLQQVNAYQQAYYLMAQFKLDRNGRQTHSPLYELGEEFPTPFDNKDQEQ